MNTIKILAWVLLYIIPFSIKAQTFSKEEIARYKAEAAAVKIIRDQWGIPHIYGKTDANTVFGLLYAQCEDDFPRVETNYIEKLGRLSEIKGESYLYNDLQIKLLIDSTEAVHDYQQSPLWLKKLLNAYADGINFYLFSHPSEHPQLLTYFKPWYALLWTDGSIGAIDVGDIMVNELKQFYSKDGNTAFTHEEVYQEENYSGSNGIALAPSKTASGNAILYINPHVTFYFRPEVHCISEEGLNTYGAVTWGQIFVYQGFNEHCGWMHTSSRADVADLYLENIEKRNDGYVYHYDNETRPVTKKDITIHYRSGSQILSKTFTTYATHHGPVMAMREGKWVSVKSNNRSVKAFMQSWLRNKATGFESYKKTMDLLSNTSNNTVFADDKGNIAYWHGDFIPRRDPKYDWNNPVDGSTSVTEWKGLHPVEEIIHVYNPKSGFIQNCNSTPFTVSGESSPKRENYPAYMAPDGENFRGINASRILNSHSGYTIDKIIKDGWNTHLSAFDLLIPSLVNSYQSLKDDNPYKAAEPLIQTLANWDKNTMEHSVATTLAIYWAEKLQPKINKVITSRLDIMDQVVKTKLFLEKATPEELLEPLLTAEKELENNFGSWNIEWGTINRYQRLTGNLNEQYNDDSLSIPDGFASSTWGCLPSFASKTMAGTKKRYGYNGNSFICAVEFGKRIKAKSLLAGGESGHKSSVHFGDQAEMYTKGEFKDVNFYREDVLKNAVRSYHPGE